MRKMGLIGMMAAMLVAPVLASQWGALSVPEMAAKAGATHVAIYEYSDFTTSATNTAQAFSNAIPANTGVECVAMYLDKAFDTANTNYTGSLTLTVGDASDADRFLTSTELASDGTEVFVKYGQPAYSQSGMSVTNLVTLNASTNAQTNALITISSLVPSGQALYTTATNIVLTFTPNLNEAVADNVQGSVRVYFRLFQFGK